jgi:FeS assembly SUF system regulator
MIKISRLADYGLIILNFLAQNPQQCHSAAVLAEMTGIALPTVSKVLKLLNEAKVITSSRGVNGGYRMAKGPEHLNVAEIIAAVDGLPALTECCQVENRCVHNSRCSMRSHWQLINRVVIQALSQFTLADLQRPQMSLTRHG